MPWPVARLVAQTSIFAPKGIVWPTNPLRLDRTRPASRRPNLADAAGAADLDPGPAGDAVDLHVRERKPNGVAVKLIGPAARLEAVWRPPSCTVWALPFWSSDGRTKSLGEIPVAV